MQSLYVDSKDKDSNTVYSDLHFNQSLLTQKMGDFKLNININIISTGAIWKK